MDDDSGSIQWDPAGGTINGNAVQHETVKFYANMCPKYEWTGPAYGMDSTELDPFSTETNLAITLRQFGFGQTFDGFYYHCEVCIKYDHL